MPIFTGSTAPADLRVGSTAVKAVYLGSTQVWTRHTPLAASLSATSVEGYPTSAPVTVTATGGSGNYTYQWEYHSGSPGIFVNSSTAQTTTFWALLALGQMADGLWRCRVSDGISSVYSPLVSITLTGNDVVVP